MLEKLKQKTKLYTDDTTDTHNNVINTNKGIILVLIIARIDVLVQNICSGYRLMKVRLQKA